MNLKLVAATVASLGIIALSPVSAYAAGGCAACFTDCIDAYGQEDPIYGYYFLGQCFNTCTDDNGSVCGSAPTGG